MANKISNSYKLAMKIQSEQGDFSVEMKAAQVINWLLPNEIKKPTKKGEKLFEFLQGFIGGDQPGLDQVGESYLQRINEGKNPDEFDDYHEIMWDNNNG